MFEIGQKWQHKETQMVIVIVDIKGQDLRIQPVGQKRMYWVRAKILSKYFKKVGDGDIGY